nr:DEAD-box ATP-dependent RNA helicase 31-like [Tanacetum cinerariifolium]
MPIKFLTSLTRIITMKTNPSFTRVFPHKLKYKHFSKHASGSTSTNKSLIEDEAELSDWVNDLKHDSFKKSRLYSDSDNDNGNNDRFDDRRGGRGEGFDGKRKRGSENGGFGNRGESSGRGRENGRGGRGSGGSRGGGRFGGEMERRNDWFVSEFNKGGRGSFAKGKESFSGERRGDDGFVSKRRDDRFSGGGRGGRGGGVGGRGGKNVSRGSVMVSDEDESEEEEGRKNVINKFTELISDDDDDDDDDESSEEDGEDVDDEEIVEKPVNVNPPRVSPDGSESYLSETRFDQCAVSPLSLKAIKDAGYEKMTVVQEATLPVILKGKDVLAKARTGTGKTVAFLLPSIEAVVKSPAVGRDQKRPPILVLVVCPTRELASQAAMEANKLIKYHTSLGVQVVIGGTRLALEQKRMQASPCQILVATPGRLKDHIENTAGFATRLMGVKVLVLDEADHLLDMGFRKDIEKIVAAVPKQRQTLLFSATVPPEVRQICHIALKRDHEYINTVREGSEETHTQVQQTHLVAPLDKQFSILYSLLKDHIADDTDYKVLVFCTTAMVTKLIADLLGELKLNVREIHSRKPQSYRTRVSDEFRRSKCLILVTSDVSARGVDYPDVTLVIQVGLPADKAQYIHRLGRTGRKGKEGQGILLLALWEQFFLSTLKELPISKAELPLVDPNTKKQVEKALSNVEMKNKESAYQAWLGYYNSNKTIGKDKFRLVELANEFSRSMGLDNPPAIPKLVLGKMGLKNVPGLRSK